METAESSADVLTPLLEAVGFDAVTGQWADEAHAVRVLTDVAAALACLLPNATGTRLPTAGGT